MVALGVEPLTDELQIQEMARAIRRQQEGAVKGVGRPLDVCFGLGSADSSEAFVRGVVPQSNDTACFIHALGTSTPGCSRFNVVCRVAPHVSVVRI